MKVEEIRKDFPILDKKIHGKPLIYFDNAATTQKPLAVIEAVNDYYNKYNANIHRSPHQLGYEATELYESTRVKVARFINAPSPEEVIFTKNASESINLVAYSWGLENLKPGDEVLLSIIEHHSNIIPWQIVSRLTGARLVYVGVKDDLSFDLDDYRLKLNNRTRMVAITGMSNALGVITPVRDIVELAHARGIPVLVDGAQSVAHFPVDVQDLGCDFLAFSGHKLLGPTGSGVLWGRGDLLEKMPPFLGGGEMIKEVNLDGSTYAAVPHKFEAGTPDIAAVVGLGAALDYISKIGMEWVFSHSQELLKYALERLREYDDITLYGPENRGGIISFTMPQAHPHDIATILDQEGVAIRAGHHCAQPLMRYLQVESTARASFYIYNTYEEVDKFVAALKQVREIFG